ncbi:MAG: alanine racemase [Bacilli bacterium]|nr:alanine racemase [Bacilli bacterium]
MYRRTYALIDLEVLKNNVKVIVSKYPYKYYIGVVKANAYGHGDFCVNSLIEGGINYLAASSLEECLSLRERNSHIPILCLEPINYEYLNLCESSNITITIPDMDYFNGLDKNLNLKAHIKIDNGMNRLGFKDKNEVKLVVDGLSESSIVLEGIYTHFATSGMWDKHWDDGLNNFKEITSLIDLSKIPIVHLGRSLTMVQHEMPSFVNGVRLGIIMFGLAQKMNEPTGLRLIKRNHYIKKHGISPVKLSNDLNLKTAFSLHSEIMCIKKVKAGEYISYGANYVADKDILIGIMPIGYADGLSKKNEGLMVKINDKEYPIVGDICMDMAIVKIDDSVKLNDEVIIYDNISKRCKELGVSAYQLFTSVTNRVPRVYKENDNFTEIKY